MFRIRQEHIEFLTEDRKKDALHDISDILLEENPTLLRYFEGDKDAWDGEMFERAEIALKLGMNTKATIKQFIEFTFILGKNFADEPEFKWSQKIFKNEKLSAKDKYKCFYNTFYAKAEVFFPTDKYTVEKNAPHFDLGEYAPKFDIEPKE